MSSDVKKTSDIDSVAVDNMGGHIVAVPGSTSANTTEKRTLPLLYVQSSINKSNIGDSGNESLIPINVPKFGAPVAVSSVSNGVAAGAKLVQVQTPSQNIAYVGTLFKQSKGKDMVPQKVLLTPVKGKEVSMARLILPRPSTPSPQGIIPGKKICRSFVVSPVTQTSLIKPNDSTSGKLVQPNIIRPRGVEAKILTNAVIKPATVTKASVPPGLTLVKSPQVQAQCHAGDKTQMKVILVDMKDDVTEKSDVKTNDLAKANKVTVNDDSSKNEITSEDIVTIEDESEKNDKPLIKATESESEAAKPVGTTCEYEKTVDNKTTMHWDEKETNSPLQSTGDRARKRKGSLISSTAGTAKKILIGDPYENIKLFPGGDEYDPFKIIDWDSQGLGNLPDSSIKIVKNEFDMVELLESGELTGDRNKSDEIFCCLSCGCYGLITEFYNENYCSIGCRDDLIALQHSIFSKKDSDVEMSDSSDKNKTTDSGGLKMNVVANDSKSSERKMSIDDESPVSKSNDSDVIDLIDASSPDSESSIKKVANEDIRLTKMKKIITKGYKISRKSDLLKPPSQHSPEKIEKPTKIKLRPRGSGKINKSSSTEDIVAQDLDLGSTNNDNDSPKKKSRFRWNAYLNETKSSGAWVKLFNNPFPCRPNRFKVGQRLEAIDPEHQSKICLVSVAEVKGYRLKLHFDGYPKDYDFWINADNPNLFPSEFCNKHKIPLLLPPGLSSKHFDWDTYLSRNNAKAAPQSCFENNSSNLDQVNLFKVDMKLEAVDRKNTFLVCVSTVAAVMENRILVHFDSWDDMYDYWVDISSPYIRPVGWCKNANHELTPPNGIKPEDFSWKKYLKETRSIAAPEKAFVLRPPIEFKKGLKIEAVDKRAPHLIRVASIAEVLPYQVKITFDGFPGHFGYWVDDDCCDIHPVGWSSRAGHPLEPPPTAEDFHSSSCPTPGCIGQGYFHGTKKECHKLAKNCPYTTENLVKDSALTDRLKWSTKAMRRNSEDVINLSDDSAEESDEEPAEMKWAWMKMRQGLKNGVIREKGADYVDDSKGDDEVSNSENEMTEKKESTCELLKDSPMKEESVKTEECSVKEERSPSIEKTPNDEESSKSSPANEEVSLDTNVKVKEEKTENEITSIKPTTADEPKSISPLKSNSENINSTSCNSVSKDNCSRVSITAEEDYQNENNPLYWTIHQVSKFTRPLISCSKDCFLEEEIDGQGLLMLNKNDLLEYLGLSDSDAERVYSNIILLRQKAVL
ncbi:lethal(3)malignant brain tumor-like protein 3 isoform X2 [Halyomorpha halys]|nr:uncharacterized protein LOC106689857 [Halyomorpha halys]XP_024218068.1 uncharacterized protein LOC106689857 [Halyomorpha halys]XP_024218069.1 uncharacterized protein LOC106689857 [Halyomorpha halys]XP_024218070.1 uncharacterized protein LOC106689857 [Halyomorpha halys]XP_024218071.1 uncharacterized protein LOC106689857 [Halyomorpha halys]